jgi:hypothetical protein
VSSGQIGCAEEEIAITNDSREWASRTWTAECRGKRFFCTAVQTGKDQSQVNCKEESPTVASTKAPLAVQPAPKSSDSGGCRYDTQCKGDRICVKGECVAPVGEASPAAPTPSQAAPAAP